MPKTQWKPGDKPEAHPRYKEQLALEYEMQQRGAEHFRQMVANAKDPGARKLDRKTGTSKAGRYPSEMTRVHTIRSVMRPYVEDLGDALKTWYSNHGKTRGPKPLAWHHIQGLDPYVVSFIVIRTLFDGVGQGHQGLNGLASHIGMEIEKEQRMEAWIAEEPKLWKAIQDDLRRKKATDIHRQRVNVHAFNKEVREKINWHDWTPIVRKQIGLKLLDILVRLTSDFWIGPDPLHVHIPGSKRTITPRYVVGLSDKLLKHIGSRLNHDEVSCPQYLPCIIPPKRWEGIRNGGYYSKWLKVPFLIRFKADSQEVQEIATDEYDTLEMPRVSEAVRIVQEVPWRINTRVLEIAEAVWDRDLAIAGFSHQQPQPIPPRPWGNENPKNIPTETVKKWKVEAAGVYAANARLVSSTHGVRTTLWIANRFRKEEFYFPHMLDFRGRMYPIPVFLNPQGQDLARGLLTFAQGRPVKAEDAGWLAIHVANTWGEDKEKSFDERIAWVDQNQDMWLRIAKDPLKSLEWARLDDPWQGLAAALEWARWLKEGEGMVSSLPVRVDGTCNGIQHLAALMRDNRAGEAVNLTPGDHPRDIYKLVGNGLLERLQGIRDAGGKAGHTADLWLEGLNEDIPRSLTKNPVMVLPYGGTKDSYFGSIIKWLGKNDPNYQIIAKDDRKEAVPFLKERMWDEVTQDGSILGEVQKCMEWLKECAGYVANSGAPIFWTTPSGFHVRHFYGTVKMKRIETRINGKRISLADYTRTKKLAKREQLQGISPNYVHSLDASTNMETILRFYDMHRGQPYPPPFTTIHDAYGTVTGAMWELDEALRAAFVWVHRKNNLDDFRDKCVLMYRDWLWRKNPEWPLERCWETAEDTIPRCPPQGSLDIELVLKSRYFFA